MPDYTEKYHLKKPKPEEFADIADLNSNADIIDEALGKKVDLGADGKVPVDQLPAMNFIPAGEKGAAGGVAALGSDGKVPESQLPEMDYIPLAQKGAAEGVASLGTDGKVPEGQLPDPIPTVTTEGTGEAYTATVPGVTELKNGMLLTIIPHTTSTTTDVTLNVNGLGAKGIRRYVSSNTLGTALPPSETWLREGKAILLQLTGIYWTALGPAKTAMSDLSGTLTVDKGGTGRASWPQKQLVYATELGQLGTVGAPDAASSILMQDPGGVPRWGTPEEVRDVLVSTISVIPSQSGTVIYNGSVQSPAWNGYDTEKLTIGGTTSSTNAGTYTATFTPKEGFKWADGSTDPVSVEWIIGKGNNTLTVDSTTLMLNKLTMSAKFTVTRNGSGSISATSSAPHVAIVSSINQITGEVIVNSVSCTPGIAVITVYVAEDSNYFAPAAKDVSVQAQFFTIYGVEWDWTNSGPTKGIRTDAASGFGDPSPAVNNGTGSSPFDELMPWTGMVKETRAGGVEVKEPKYWFKWTKTGKKLKLQIADGPMEGFHVDPVNMDKGDGLGELDFSYIGRYHCGNDYKSTTNVAQKTNITRRSARSGIHGLGDNFWQIDFAQMWYIGMLYLVEFADWNSQATIGYGCSANKSKENNGTTDAMQYHTGTTAANRNIYGFTQYRNIEGWWDNVRDWIDGCRYNNSGLNVIINPNQFSDTSYGALVGMPVKGSYPSDFTIPAQSGLEWALFPCATGGSETTYTSDPWSFSGGGGYAMFHGGSYGQFLSAGAFSTCDCSNDQNDDMTGCRLQERPPKTA